MRVIQWIRAPTNAQLQTLDLPQPPAECIAAIIAARCKRKLKPKLRLEIRGPNRSALDRAFLPGYEAALLLTTDPLSGGVSRHYPLSTTAQIAVIDPSSIDCRAWLLIDPVVPKRAAAPDDQRGVAGLDRASAIGACFPGHIRGGNTPWEQT
jgi:hypothetical protein